MLSVALRGDVGIAVAKLTWVKWIMLIEGLLHGICSRFSLFLLCLESLWAGSWSAQLTIEQNCRISWLRLDLEENNTAGFSARAYHPWSKKEVPPSPSFRILLNLCFFCDLKAQNGLITRVCLLSEASAAAERMPGCLLMGTSVIFYLFCNLNLWDHFCPYTVNPVAPSVFEYRWQVCL